MEFGAIVLACLLLKHWLVDFPLQRPYQYLNKGTYGHLGGIEHALFHALGTFLVFVVLGGNPFGSLVLALADGVVHYHIDWLKVNLCREQGWSETIPKTTYYNTETTYADLKNIHPHLAIYSDWYFQALGADQLMHHVTYVILVLVAL